MGKQAKPIGKSILHDVACDNGQRSEYAIRDIYNEVAAIAL